MKEKHLLDGSAIVVAAGQGKEDRMMTGSYLALREKERKEKEEERKELQPKQGAANSYLPDFLK